MRRKVLLVTTLGLTCFLGQIAFGSVKSEEEAKGSMNEAQAEAPFDEEMMANWQAYAAVSENHKVLDVMVGNWDHKVQYWMSKDGSSAEESAGTSEIKWIFGGRYLQHMVKGTSMGQPFEGMALIGYDNMRKEYNTMWIDSMGTGMMKGNGQYNQETHELTEAGDFSCPMVNGTQTYRAVTKFIDDDNYTYEAYKLDENGEEYRSMLITYSRQK